MSTPRVRLRPEIESLVPYRQGRPAADGAFKLSSNENPFPPLAAVLEAIARLDINRYPDASAAELRGAIASRFGISPGMVQVGAGSVSVLDQLISATAAAGDEIITSWRSFEAYPLLISTAGASMVAVPSTPDHRHDLVAMAAAVTERTRLIIVCSPNNPTSTIVTRAEFLAFMGTVPPTVLVVLDEAYAEFVSDPDAVVGPTLIAQFPNLVVLRTFSKAYGLAGLRIGYALGQEYVMDAARAVAIPLAVTEQAQRAAIVSLEHEAQLLERVAQLAVLRDEIWQGLVDLGWDAPRPHGNFVWLPTGAATQQAADTFRDHGVIARPLGEGLRVSVGERESVEKLLAAAAEVGGLRRTVAAAATLD